MKRTKELPIILAHLDSLNEQEYEEIITDTKSAIINDFLNNWNADTASVVIDDKSSVREYCINDFFKNASPEEIVSRIPKNKVQEIIKGLVNRL